MTKKYYGNVLCHYGVKGMQWGVRKEYQPVDKRYGQQTYNLNSATQSQSAQRRQTAKIQRSKLKNEWIKHRFKTVVTIGAAVAATTLAAYGFYKFKGGNTWIKNTAREIYKQDELLPKIWPKMKEWITSGANFIKNAFSKIGKAVTKTVTSSIDKAAAKAQQKAFQRSSQNAAEANQFLKSYGGSTRRPLSKEEISNGFNSAAMLYTGKFNVRQSRMTLITDIAKGSYQAIKSGMQFINKIRK